MRWASAHNAAMLPLTRVMLVGLAGCLLGGLAPHAALADETVYACQGPVNEVFAPSNSNSGQFSMPLGCPMQIDTPGGAMSQGTGAYWQANAPAGLTIVGVDVPSFTSNGVNDGAAGEYGGDFYWSGGDSLITPVQTSFSTPPGFSSSDFGMFIVCGLSTCTLPGADIVVYQASLTVQESSPPSLLGDAGLWTAGAWLRGVWALDWTGDSASGVCSLSASLAGQALPGDATSPDPTLWKQCGLSLWFGDSVHTDDYPDGADRLVISDSDAAGESSSAARTVLIDNQTPTVSLTGPANAPVTSGTQYVTATASAGPSGVYGIDCSVDGAAAQWYPASSAQVPVSGVGDHVVSCYSESNAVSQTGVHGTSAPASFSIEIGTPTVAAVAFDRVVHGLRCHRVTERVRIPARWVTITVHGHPTRVRERAHTQRIAVTRCHMSTVRRRIAVWVTVRRRGHKVKARRDRLIRVAEPPQTVADSTRTVAHGHRTTVDGWVGTATGAALAGQPVDVYTAADNGRNNYHLATTATTASDGSWSAVIGAGPSRLIKAYYPGASELEPAQSTPVALLVPARVRLLAITPRRVAWGATIRISGRLEGGYFPPGGALIRLRYGTGPASTTYGVREHVGGHHGLFSTTYTFGAGDPALYRSFWFQLATLPMGDYPYAPATSNRRSVLVGGNPTTCCRSG